MKEFKEAITFTGVMVSAVILLVGILAALSSYFSMGDLAKSSDQLSLATRVAAAKMEEIRSDSFEDLGDYHENIFPTYVLTGEISPQDVLLDDLEYRGVVYVDEEIAGLLKKVTIVVGWRKNDRIVGPDWLFDSSPDPSAHSRAESPVTLVTYMGER
jgi:hypothetical protein